MSKLFPALCVFLGIICTFFLLFIALKWDYFAELTLMSALIGFVMTLAVWEVGSAIVILWDRFTGKGT